MSYQVLARKYRPQTFADLTGQEHISRTLASALDARRLHHAYLFSGVRGTGKTSSARILAKGLNCISGPTSRPCLDCPSCREIAAGNSIDVIEIDAASNTGIDNVRDVIINNIAIAPARDRFKIFIIDEVHMLSPQAFNALLKTLEEPPSHVVFIMATTELHKVPDTILSRCQQFEFRHIPTTKILARLREIAAAEGVEAGDAALGEIARAGRGSLRDAISAFDQVIAFSGGSVAVADVTSALGLVGAKVLGRAASAIADSNGAETIAIVDELASGGYDLRGFTRELMAYLRNLLVIKSGITNGDALGVADFEIPGLVKLAQRFSEEDLVRSFHLLAAIEKEIKDSGFPRFTLEVGLFKLTHALRLRPLDELIARLDALAAQLNIEPGNIEPAGSDSGAAPQSPSPASVRSVRSPDSRSMSQVKPVLRPVESEPKSESKPESRSAAKVDPKVEPKIKTRRTEPASAENRSGPVEQDSFDSDPFGAFDPLESVEPPDWVETEATARRSDRSPARAALPAQDAAANVVRGKEVEAILAELDRLNRGLLVTALEEARDISVADGVLSVRYDRDHAFAHRLRDSQSFFRDLGERLLGAALRVEVSIGDAAAQADRNAEPKVDPLRERALANPAVRRFLDKFRGEIIDVEQLPK